MGKAERTYLSVTKETSVYYYKLTNGNVVTLIDTPGLGDSDKIKAHDTDDKHLQGIMKVISEEKIHIKGILFLVNFQNERFDYDEINALLNYNKVFPLKSFWKNLIVIYSHFYVDPNEDEDLENIIKSRSESNGAIFETIMEKVKEVSDPISYQDLQKRYFNSYSIANNNKKKKSNDKIREELEIIFDELSKKDPLFSRVEIQHIQNHKWNENGKEFVGEVEIIGFFDFNQEPIKERMNIIKKEEIKKQEYYPPPSYYYSGYRGVQDENDDKLNIESIPKEELRFPGISVPYLICPYSIIGPSYYQPTFMETLSLGFKAVSYGIKHLFG